MTALVQDDSSDIAVPMELCGRCMRMNGVDGAVLDIRWP